MPQSQLSARQIDLFNPSHVKKIVLEIDSEQNRARKRNAWIAHQCKNDNQKEYVIKALKALYPETYNKFRVGNIKIAKKIVEKLAKAYKNAPLRTCENETETNSLNEIYEEYDFHRAFKEADEIFNLHKYVYMWLTFQNPSEDADKHFIPIEEGNYVLHALAPYEYDLVRDQVTGEPLIFILSYPDSTLTRLAGRSDGIEQTISESQSDTSAQTTIYKMWSPTQYCESTVKRAKGHGNSSEEDFKINIDKKKENELDRLPGGYLQADTAIDYPVKADLAQTSIDWNVSYSDLKTAASTQGHGQLLIRHPEGQNIKQVHMGMHTAMMLPQSKKPDAPETNADYISASPDLAGQLEVAKFDLMGILDDYRIKPKGIIEGGANQLASGFARLVDEADAQDVVEDNQSLYKTSLEQDVFLTLKAHEDVMGQKTFTKTEKLAVSYEKPKVLITDKEIRENIKFDEENGLSLPHEKHMVINPNLTVDEAKAREEEIQQINKERMAEMVDMIGEEDEDGNNNEE